MDPNTPGQASAKSSPMQRFLSVVERGGNALPHPATLFFLFAAAVVVLSEVAARVGIEVVHPKTGAAIQPFSLMSLEGLHKILTQTVTNFTGFAPLGTVLVALLGIGVAESTGLIGAAMRALVLSSPRKLLTPVVVFAGVMSNVGSEIGYVLLVPLAARIFMAAGRHPLLGLSAAFAGVSGGYSANLLLGTIDPLLAGLTQEAARLTDPTFVLSPACNYYFMCASTFVVTLVGWWVAEKLVAPRLGGWRAEDGAEVAVTAAPADDLRALAPAERRGLLFAGLATAALTVVLLAGTVPETGFLRDPKTHGLLHSPFMSGIVTIIFVAGVLLGVAYGIGARTLKNDEELVDGMAKSMKTLGGYLVLVFFAAQFVAYFNWTNLGLIVAVKGAEFLRSASLDGPSLMVAFIFLTAFMNLFMGSASAKWAVMAPVFVPMFSILGYEPALTQCAYRVGDSCTNIISPMMSYFALIIAFYQTYDKKAGIGSLVATMLPYSVVFLIVWTLFFLGWVQLGLPLGPSPSAVPVPTGPM